ncbi:MAG TPA: hypothetical protein VGI39_27065 [Polyangiaceae bacterium]
MLGRTSPPFLVFALLATATTASAAPPPQPIPALPPPAPATAPAPTTPDTATPAPAPEESVTRATPRAPPAPPPPPPGEPPPAPPPPCPQPPDAYRHDGFYFRFATGISYGWFSGNGASGNVSADGLGSNGAFSFGGTVTKGFVVGGAFEAGSSSGQIHGGKFDGAEISSALVFVGPFVDWYPDPTDGWHVGAKAGIGVAGVSNTNISLGGFDVGGGVFGGYDWWIGPQWSLGLQLAFMTGTTARLNDSNNNSSDSGYRVTPSSMVLSWTLTLH